MMMNLDFHLILASESPRRSEILKQAEIEFEVRSPDFDEEFPQSLDINDVAEWISMQKAKSIITTVKSDEVVLAADTVVIENNQILGKPTDRDSAIEMISQLCGKTHLVMTGCTLMSIEKNKSFKEITEVTFKDLSRAEIEYYVDKYSPLDKAGAYGIQEWIGLVGITKISGSYFNVVGLPVQLVYQELANFRP